MSFDWQQYFYLAKHLNDKADNLPDFKEACYRSAVSRAYYAVYCLARNFVRDVDKQTFYGDDHQKLKNYLITHSHKSHRKLGNQLNKLRADRNKADYNDDLGEPPINKANKALAHAERAFATLNDLAK